MLFLSLKEIQDYMPEHNIGSLQINYHPVLEVYRAILWTDEYWYQKYIPVGLAPDVEHVLQFLKVSLEAELQSVTKRGLTWKK